MGARRLLVCLLASTGWLSFSVPAFAIDDSNVLVLYNTASPDGDAIAHYYQTVHPGVTLLPLNGVSTSESISADEYLSTIYQPVHAALTSNTQVIVTTKGMPLRITVPDSAKPPSVWPNPPSYTDPNGVQHQISNWKPYSSLESELADVDKISTAVMMGDQSYSQGNFTQFSSNPYYGATTSFSHATTGTRLTARLDGYTAAQVEGAIDRAQHAFIGPANSPNGPFHFIVDNHPTDLLHPAQATGSITSLANNLNTAGLPVTYDNTTGFVSSTTGPLIGYDGFGNNQSSTPPNYITNGLNVTLANGAVFTSWESFNAATFSTSGDSHGQGQVAQWLQAGGTAGVGNVTEPTASTATMANEDKLFQMLINGKTFAEAAWSSERQLSWVNTVVGDPLMTWKTLMGGDANMDGHVDGSDLAILGTYWGQTVPGGGLSWAMGDLNGDGHVDISDLSLLSATWGQTSSWAMGQGESPGSAFPGLSSGPSVPEPSSWILMAAGIGTLLAGRAAARRRRSQVARRHAA